MKTGARFCFEDARITRVKELPKVCFVSVLVQAGKYPDFQEVVLFQPPAFSLEEGLAITVTGDIQKRKPKERGGEWKNEFIGRNVIKGDDAKAPRPRTSGAAGPAPSTNTTENNQGGDDDLLF